MSYGPKSHRLVADDNDDTFNMEIESVHSNLLQNAPPSIYDQQLITSPNRRSPLEANIPSISAPFYQVFSDPIPDLINSS